MKSVKDFSIGVVVVLAFLTFTSPAFAQAEKEEKAPFSPGASQASDIEHAGLTFSQKAQVRSYIDMAVEAHDSHGDLDGAEQWLERALEIDPYHPVARKMLKQVKAEKQQAGLGRMGVALGTLQQMSERMERHEEDQPQEEGGAGMGEESSVEKEEEDSPTSPDESTTKGPVFGKGRVPPVDIVKDSPEPKTPTTSSVQHAEEAGSPGRTPMVPSTEALARALQLALPHRQVQEQGSSSRQMYDESKEQAAYSPWRPSDAQTVDASRLAEKRCSAVELEELQGMLNETGRMLLLLLASREDSSGASKSSSGVSPPLPPKRGQAFMELLGQLCEKLKGIKPKGMKGILPKGGKVPGGCAWALFVQDLGGPGGDMGQRTLACIQKHSQQGPPPMEATQVHYPAEKCGRGKPKRKPTFTFKPEIIYGKEYRNERYEYWSKFLDVAEHNAKVTQGKEREMWKRAAAGAYLNAGMWSDEGTEGHAGEVMVYQNFGDGWIGITTKDVSYLLDTGTGAVIKYDNTKEPKDKSKPAEGGGKGRPTEPGEGDCGQTPAQKRAQAIFDCIFGGPPQVAPGGTPEPVSHPAGPSGPPPTKDCNEVNMAAIWGSSTAAGGGATDPEGPEDLMKGGPPIVAPEWGSSTSLRGGAIDPQKDVVSVPGGGKGKDKKGLPGDEDVPPGKGRDD